MMLTWHNVWMASHGREMARELKAAGHEVVTGKRTLAALGVVVGVAVLREGSEVVLFLYGIAAQGGVSNAGLLAGGALGLAAGAAVSALMYLGLLTIPAGRLFQVTSGLITLLAAGMAAQAVLFLQNGGTLTSLTGRFGIRPGCCRKTALPAGCCIPWSATAKRPMARNLWPMRQPYSDRRADAV